MIGLIARTAFWGMCDCHPSPLIDECSIKLNPGSPLAFSRSVRHSRRESWWDGTARNFKTPQIQVEVPMHIAQSRRLLFDSGVIDQMN
jgi:hypothetical protein